VLQVWEPFLEKRLQPAVAGFGRDDADLNHPEGAGLSQVTGDLGPRNSELLSDLLLCQILLVIGARDLGKDPIALPGLHIRACTFDLHCVRVTECRSPGKLYLEDEIEI